MFIKLSIGILKTQNQALVSRLNILKSKLKSVEDTSDGKISQQINCTMSVEMFSNQLNRVDQCNLAIPVHLEIQSLRLAFFPR